MKKDLPAGVARCCLSLLPAIVLLLAAGAGVAAESGVNALGQGIAAYNSRDFSAAAAHLAGATEVRELADYVACYRAWAQLLTGNVDGAIATVAAYREHPIASSPLAGRISLVYGRALLDKHEPEATTKALNILQADYKLLPQPDGDFAQALAYEAQGERQQAALAYERVFYAYPNTDLAAQSWTAMERLREGLGKDFPVAPAREQLDRAAKWLDAKEYAKARKEYSTLEETLSDPDKDEAKLGIGVTDYLSGDVVVAFHYLKSLHVAHSETDAERLYYLTEAARKQGDDTAMLEAIKDLEQHYPKSVWRLKALVTAGNRYLATNEHDRFEPLFKAAYETFPADNSTAYCHWKVAWDAYMNARPERAALMREQVEDYPDDSRAGTALYYLGRMAEGDGKYGEARAYYERLSAQYPHYFYAVLARARIQGKVADAMPDKDAVEWLAEVDWPEHRDLSATEPNAATALRIQRARLLQAAGLTDMADAELRFGAKTDSEQPQLLGIEAATTADSPFRALRIMKSFSGDYLSLPLEKASIKFWQMLFPLPYKDELFQNARAHGLDPFYVAGLIRQESEFNPTAKSHANAYGLMQLLPSTGRMLGRKEGISVPTSLLLNPAVSIRLGTQYLRGQLDSWDGDWYRTLAAYNAGPSRVRQWLNFANFREPVEFIETIPFTETREYVQAVLRNADMYRELYSGKHTLAPVPVYTQKKLTPVQVAALLKPRHATQSPKRTTVAAGHSAAHRAAPKKSVAQAARKKKREPTS